MLEVLKNRTFEWNFIDDGEKSSVREEGRGKAHQLELGWQKWFGSRVVYKGPRDASLDLRLDFGEESLWESLLVLGMFWEGVLPWSLFSLCHTVSSSWVKLPHLVSWCGTSPQAPKQWICLTVD